MNSSSLAKWEGQVEYSVAENENKQKDAKLLFLKKEN